MKKAFIIINIILCSQFLMAEDYPREFGVVSDEEFALTNYDKDPEAEALVLYDIGKSWFIREDGGFDIVFERSTRIKIFSEAGLDYAEVEIPLYQEGEIWETVDNIEAYTYNEEDGEYKVTKLEKKESFRERINAHWSLVKFVLPNVKPGSIIEYRYRVNSPYIFNLQDWEFQRSIPTLFSEYTVKLTPFYAYTFILQGAAKFDSYNSYVDKGLSRQFGPVNFQDMVHIYTMKDVPAFKSEEYITSRADYIMKMDFQLSKITHANGATQEIMTSWEKMTKDYYDNDAFGKYIKKSEKYYPKFMAGKSQSFDSDSAQIRSIVSDVKEAYSWNGIYSRMATTGFNDFLKKKTGSVADINLLLTGFLREAGYEAYPVLLSTRGNGRIWKQYPFSSFFNYVIAMVKLDGNYLLLDATTLASSDLQIPPRCFNETGLVMKEGSPEWVPLRPGKLSKLEHSIELELKETDLNARVKILAKDYMAYDFRTRYGKDLEKMEESLSDKYTDGSITAVSINDGMNAETPYEYSFSVESAPEVINGKMFINPFLREAIDDNPFKQASRNYPVDFVYPRHISYHVQINIPEGYRVEYVPENKKIMTNEFLMEYTVNNDETKLTVDLQYAIPKSVYENKDYARIKFCYNELLSKSTDRIVLVKNDQE